MKINRKQLNQVIFQSVPQGAFFYDRLDREQIIYRKTNAGSSNTLTFNAMEMSTGKFVFFPEKTPVIVINCELNEV